MQQVQEMAELRCMPHKIPRKMASDRAGAGGLGNLQSAHWCPCTISHLRGPCKTPRRRVVMRDVMCIVVDLELSAYAPAFGGGQARKARAGSGDLAPEDLLQLFFAVASQAPQLYGA